MANLLNQTIKGYELREVIGEGGFGAVYRAYQPAVGRDVAIKIILPDFANQPDFIRRFEVEAQLVARLEHPYIIPLYDYWREPGGAYLVMRLLRGGSLRESIRRGPWKAADASHILDQIAGALVYAHHNGVIHRDLKPANILLDESGNAYLSDFGIAKNSAMSNSDHDNEDVHPDMIIGSPAYVSPEQIMGEPIIPQSDIYSLGIILYEMLTGQHPFQETQLAALLVKHVQEPTPSVLDLRPDLAQGIDRVIQKATAKKPQERYANAASFAAALRRAVANIKTGELPAIPVAAMSNADMLGVEITPSTPSDLEMPRPENPYKGLRAFQEADAHDFFGREALVGHLLERMQETDDPPRFLAVLGPSGSGKSSVVLAGLIPAMRRGALANSERWFIVEMTPGTNPIDKLEAALLSVSVNPGETISTILRADDRGLVRATRRILPQDNPYELVLFIDQFEELFTMTQDESARSHFMNVLTTAANEPYGRFRLIIALRADFYDKPLLYPEFANQIRKSTEVILPLSPDELERAIVAPAERVGVMMEPGLVAAIVAEVSQQPGALPMLQYALTELFERREGRKLTRNAYNKIGGVLGALARRAEEIYLGLAPEAQEATRQLFLRLVTPGEGTEDTRRRVLRSELSTVNAHFAIDAVIDIFGKNRLLTFDRDPATRASTVEVAHEALVREWSRLREWLNANRENLRVQRLLTTAASEWYTSGKDASFLASGARLTRFEILSSESDLVLSNNEVDYLHTSIAYRESIRIVEESRQRRELELQHQAAGQLRFLVIALTLFLVLATILTVTAVNSQAAAVAESVVRATQQQIAQDNAATAQSSFRRLAQSESRRLANEANEILDGQDAATNSDLTLLLALKALQIAYSPEADSVLLRALSLTYVQKQFVGHTDIVNSVAFSPDGKLALSASDDRTLRLWDIDTARELRQFIGHTDIVNSVAFSPDGKLAVSGSNDGTVRLWAVDTGEALYTLHAHTVAVRVVAFSPDSLHVASGGRDNIVRIWDVQTGRQVTTIRGAKNEITALNFNPDGNSLFIGSFDGLARRVQIDSGDVIQTYTGHAGNVTSARFSGDGHLLVTGSDDKFAILWNADTGQLIRTYSGHSDAIDAINITPDSRFIITSSLDGTIRLWDAEMGTQVRQYIGHGDYTTSLDISPDGHFLLTGSRDKTLRLWSLMASSESQQFSGHRGSITSVEVSPDQKYLLTGSYDNTARLWNIQTGSYLRQFIGHTDGVIAFFSHDGKYVVTGSDDHSARLWNTQTSMELVRYNGHTDRVRSVAISPDEKHVLTGSFDGTARVWDMLTGKELYVLGGHIGTVNAAYSPDGKYILTTGVDGLAILWDAENGHLIRTFRGHSGRVVAAFSPRGTLLVTGGADRTLRVWNMETGEQLYTMTGHTNAVITVAFSFDGHYVLSGSTDTTVRLWDISLGTEVHKLTGHSEPITAAIFSPNDLYILTASTDGTARLWSVESGTEIRRLVGHNGSVNSIFGLAFADDSKYIVTGSTDNTARLWSTSIDDTIRMACTHVFRDFTPAERTRYTITDDRPTCEIR